MKSYIGKGYYGWQAKTQVAVEGTNLVVEFSTMKRSSGKLVTNATVHRDEGNGFLSTMMFQDYSKAVISEAKRVTEKAVKEQHAAALAKIKDVMAEIKAQYGIA